MNSTSKNVCLKSKVLATFENLMSSFRIGSPRQDKENSPEKKSTCCTTKQIDPNSTKLTDYIDTLFENPYIRERFPVKPAVLETDEVRFLLDGLRQKSCLGSGQMGSVYLGWMETTGKTVAVKVATDPRCILGFMVHEAALMTHLNDTGSTPYCYGLLPLTASSSMSGVSTAALVMDVAGGDPKWPCLNLENFIRRMKGKLSVKVWKELFIHMCEQIHKIHKSGIIINDIKEENMLVIRTGVDQYAIKMIDFGSSKYGNYNFPIDPKLTREEFREEYSHVAPEIYMEARVNEITDVFSLSSILCDAGRFLNLDYLVFVGMKCGRTDPSMRPDIMTVINMLSDMEE